MAAPRAGRSVAGMTRTCVLAGFALLACAAPSSAVAEPVNGRIAYSTFESGNGSTGDIWTMEADGSGKQQAVFHPDNDAQADWAPDGTKIVYRSRRSSQFEISIVDFSVRDADGRPTVTDIPKAPDGTQSSQPGWFPDMSHLLYRRTNGTGTTRSDIWMMNLDGSDRHPLYVAPDDQFYPSFSPDMKKLLFSTVKSATGRNIQVLDIASGVVTTLFSFSPTSYDSAPAWSPDGSQIAFESNLDGDREIYVMNADSSNQRRITTNTWWDEGPAWSPDGKRIAFSSGADDLHLDIWTMNADGSDLRQLTTYPGRDESPDWGVNPHPAPVGATVPVVLALQLGPASFGAFTPGVDHDYTAVSTGAVTSTAGNALLSYSDPGHLMNGTFALPEALRVAPSKTVWSGPVSNDPLTVTFSQHIGATDPLRTGTYSRTLTFTLSTTEP
jgi:dipeptidyl aminopeptidase/acylaminoacyl peptidase